jgi:hypothetical protein
MSWKWIFLGVLFGGLLLLSACEEEAVNNDTIVEKKEPRNNFTSKPETTNNITSEPNSKSEIELEVNSDDVRSQFTLSIVEQPDNSTVEALPSLELSFPYHNETLLTGIQSISTSKLYDLAGYGNQFGASFALDEHGQVYAWGQRFDSWGTDQSFVPRKEEGLPVITSIEGEFALDTEGKVWFMNGRNKPYTIKGLSDVVSISEISEYSLAAVTQSGQLWLWGPEWLSREEQLYRVESAGKVKKAYGDLYSVYWIDEHDKVWQASVDWLFTAVEPAAIDLPKGEKAERIEITFDADYIMTQSGAIYKLGYEGLEITALEDIEQIAGSHTHFYLKSDGTVWGTGTDLSLLGDPKTPPELNELIEISSIKNIVDIQMGQNHVLALTQDGTILSWGSNSNGQLGQLPFFFDQFVNVGSFQDITDLRYIQASYYEIIFNLKGNVWRVNRQMEIEPVFIGKDIIKHHGEAYLTADGTLLISKGAGQLYELKADSTIKDFVMDIDGWVIELGSGQLYKIQGLNDDVITTIKEIRFPNESKPAVKEMFHYPLLTMLSQDGSVYYIKAEEDGVIWMDQISNLPRVQEWSTLNYTYFDGQGDVIRMLDDQGQAHSIAVKSRRDESTKVSSYEFEVQRIAENVSHIYGGLLEFSDGEIIETGLPEYYDAALNLEGDKNLLTKPTEVHFIDSLYAFYIEGPPTYRHVLVAQDGTLMINGDSPFFRAVVKPSPVVKEK